VKNDRQSEDTKLTQEVVPQNQTIWNYSIRVGKSLKI